MMKTTHAVEKTARVRQEFHPSDFESVQSKKDNFWEISGVLQSKNRNEFSSKRTKNYQKQKYWMWSSSFALRWIF